MTGNHCLCDGSQVLKMTQWAFGNCRPSEHGIGIVRVTVAAGLTGEDFDVIEDVTTHNTETGGDGWISRTRMITGRYCAT
ncbi:hypothetical protein N7466_006916 [Penicillium verhagenii]|uniref:uncharacterized protein n=1 Tax=Penicillium verhagenii TaxID=1562060 RepID=UPI0025450BBC|nr:uncharacterized protein N7466_006916 [Penicillium verhagenii]KAJ5927960.1 hypothetical protein N7466_006916 [Penicillium verhagenii]